MLTVTRIGPDRSPNPGAIAKTVPATRASAGWWGFNATDNTANLQAALDSPALNVSVPFMGSPWVTGPLSIKGPKTLELEPGVLIVAKEGAFDIYDPLIRIASTADVRIIGNGCKLYVPGEARKPTVGESEWGHAIALASASRVHIQDLCVESHNGDGLHLGRDLIAKSNRPCETVTVERCHLRENYRNGISVTSATGLTLRDVELVDGGQTAPKAGLCIEPNGPQDFVKDICVTCCRMAGNAGSAIFVALQRLQPASELVSIQFSNCRCRGSHQALIRIKVPQANGPRGFIGFHDVTAIDGDFEGLDYTNFSHEALDIRFVNCSWANVAKQKCELAPMTLRVPVVSLSREAISRLTFIGCRLWDTREREPVRYLTGDQNVATPDSPFVRGDLEVIKP